MDKELILNVIESLDSSSCEECLIALQKRIQTIKEEEELACIKEEIERTGYCWRLKDALDIPKKR